MQVPSSQLLFSLCWASNNGWSESTTVDAKQPLTATDASDAMASVASAVESVLQCCTGSRMSVAVAVGDSRDEKTAQNFCNV